MKKIFTVLSCAAMGLSTLAATNVNPVSYSDIITSALGDKHMTELVKPIGVKSAVTTTRSIEEPETDCHATEASFYYFGDLLENGTGVYYLFLSSAGIDRGNPTHAGQIARITFIGDETDPANPVLPEGEYTLMEDGSYVYGSIVADMTDFYDVFPHPEDESVLVGYPFSPMTGTLTIEAAESGYKIDFSMEGCLLDEADQVILEQTCTATYEGAVSYVDIYGYPPLSGDVTLDIPNASGRYSEGDYSIAFYSDGMLDEEGFIVAAGQLFNVEIFTVESSPMNLDDMVGSLTAVDVFEEGLIPGHFMKGIWYDIFGGYYVAMGTAYTLYNNDGNVTEVGLAADGTITVKKEGESTYSFDFDLVTEDGYKLIGKWEGDLADFITDFSEGASVSGIADGIKTISGGKGMINAPSDAMIYNVSGQSVGRDNLAPGVYVVKTKDRTVKVIVK